MLLPERSPLPRIVPLALFWLGACLTLCARAALKEGDPFPALDPTELRTIAGAAFPETKGKVILVDFWASWCAPCKASFPMLSRFQQEFGPRGFVVVGIGIDEKVAAAETFVRKLAPTFPTLHDHSQRLVKKVEVPTMPTSFLVGRDGKVKFIHRGFQGDRTEKELRSQIEKLLLEASQ